MALRQEPRHCSQQPPEHHPSPLSLHPLPHSQRAGCLVAAESRRGPPSWDHHEAEVGTAPTCHKCWRQTCVCRGRSRGKMTTWVSGLPARSNLFPAGWVLAMRCACPELFPGLPMLLPPRTADTSSEPRRSSAHTHPDPGDILQGLLLPSLAQGSLARAGWQTTVVPSLSSPLTHLLVPQLQALPPHPACSPRCSLGAGLCPGSVGPCPHDPHPDPCTASARPGLNRWDQNQSRAFPVPWGPD